MIRYILSERGWIYRDGSNWWWLFTERRENISIKAPPLYKRGRR